MPDGERSPWPAFAVVLSSLVIPLLAVEWSYRTGVTLPMESKNYCPEATGYVCPGPQWFSADPLGYVVVVVMMATAVAWTAAGIFVLRRWSEYYAE